MSICVGGGLVSQLCVLLKYGELAIKGRNKGRFERQLLDNLDDVLRGVGFPVRIRRRSGVLVLSVPDDDAAQEELVARARRLIGISVVQAALRVPKDSDAAATAAVDLARALSRSDPPPRFAVRARRRHKRFPMTSEQLAGYVGARVQRELGWPVDLTTPEVEITVEVDRHEVFVSTVRHPGQGGLPVGSSGRALALISGGFDSPVAAYRAMRRGLRCDFVHFTGAPYAGPASTYKAYALVHQLTQYQGNARLHVVPIGRAQRILATTGARDLLVVAQRRFMVRVACRLADRIGAQALVTGDSLGQVSSQTLPNLAAVQQSAALPVLRPLLGFDKTEIIAEATRIGTADVSRLPDEDCCTLLLPSRASTHADPSLLARIEKRVELDHLIDHVLADTQVFDIPATPLPAVLTGARTPAMVVSDHSSPQHR